ncbi:MAG: Ig-like domain-containing protein, partial [Clostridia bacterium]|nr:Ig-like domain-containing protein [Clostridia bacterium]
MKYIYRVLVLFLTLAVLLSYIPALPEEVEEEPLVAEQIEAIDIEEFSLEDSVPEEAVEEILTPEFEDALEAQPVGEAISIRASHWLLMVGSKLKLPFEIHGGREGTYSLSSKNVKIASVSGTEIKGVKAGTVEIVARTEHEETCTVSVTVVPKAKKVAFEHSTVELDIGQAYLPEIRLYSSSSKYQILADDSDMLGTGTLTTSDENVISVEADGTLRAKNKGKVTVSFTAKNGKSAKCTFIVYAQPSELTINPSIAMLPLGGTLALNPQFGEYERGALSYASSDRSVASVSNEGVVSAIGIGSTYITATLADGLSAQCEVSVVEAPVSIRIAEDMFLLPVGESMDLPVSLFTADGDAVQIDGIVLSSANAKIASVSGGRIQAVKAGTTTLKARFGSLETTCKVQVVKKLVKLQFVNTSVQIGEGAKTALSVRAYSATKTYATLSNNALTALGRFECADESIARVLENGELIGVRKGTTRIRYIVGSLSADCTLQVLGAPTKLNIQSELLVAEGKKFKLAPQFGENELGEVSWRSADSSIATVQPDGTVTGVRVGETLVTASVNGGTLSAQCVVRVTEAPQRIEAPEGTVNLLIGATIDAPVSFYTKNGLKIEGVSFSLTSSKPKVVGVQGERILGLKEGTSTITVTADGLKKTISVTVRKKPTQLKLNVSAAQMAVGENGKLSVRCYTSAKNYFDCTTVASLLGVGAFVSSNPEIVEVSADDSVYSKRSGNAVITFTTLNGLSGECAITVLAEATSLSLQPDTLTLQAG